MPNYYEVLGVTSKATETEIRNGYIAQSLKYHPDKNSDHSAKAKFQEVANAYYVLSGKDRRSKYDQDNNIVIDQSVNPITIFAELFNDLMIPEVPNPSYWYQPLGTAAGSMLGFIFLNIPGAVIGGYYGNRAGKVRDMKGTSVYEAYTKLSNEKRSEILNNIGKKFLTTAIKR